MEAEIFKLRDNVTVRLGKGAADVSLEVGIVRMLLQRMVGFRRYVDEIFHTAKLRVRKRGMCANPRIRAMHDA